MTFAEMKSDVRRRLNESGAEFFSDADIAESVQDGLDEIADLTEYFERETTVGMLAGRTYYDLRRILSDTFLSPRRCWNTTTQRWLRPTDARELDEHTYVRWELTYGQPEAYQLRGNWWLGTFPRNTDDKGGLRFYFTAIPAPLADSDEPAFPVEFHRAVPNFALFDLNAQQRETEKALAFWNLFEADAVRLKDHVERRQNLARRDVL